MVSETTTFMTKQSSITSKWENLLIRNLPHVLKMKWNTSISVMTLLSCFQKTILFCPKTKENTLIDLSCTRKKVWSSIRCTKRHMNLVGIRRKNHTPWRIQGKSTRGSTNCQEVNRDSILMYSIVLVDRLIEATPIHLHEVAILDQTVLRQ